MDPNIPRGRGRGLNLAAIKRVAQPSTSRAASLSFGRGGVLTVAQREVGPRGAGGSTAAVASSKRGTTRDEERFHNKEAYVTKPDHVAVKQGTVGKKLQLSTNYFRLVKKPEFEFNLCRVDFEPSPDIEIVRRKLLMSQRDVLGGFLFDGQNLVYLTRKLPFAPYMFSGKDNDDIDYEVTLRETDIKIAMTDTMGMQILNLILRRAMGGLGMTLVGRNLYYPDAAIDISEFKVQLWPGYVTSIRQHEEDILMCCEISHKVMREETVYDILKNLMKSETGNWQDVFKKEIIGSIVLTDYNNRTYRVDDVDFSTSPLATFPYRNKKTGIEEKISFKEYFERVKGLKIGDERQPLLISNPKPKDIRAGRSAEDKIVLVPSLCRTTGLTDRMRSDFRAMRALATHTQMDPIKRRIELLKLAKALKTKPECKAPLDEFNVEIEDRLVRFEGRALSQQTIIFGRNRMLQVDDRVDWTSGFRNAMYQTVECHRWTCIFPKKCMGETEPFLKMMMDVAKPMGFSFSNPKLIAIDNDRPAVYAQQLEEACKDDPRLIVVIVPNNAADRYGAIKKATCLKRSVPTQVIVSKTMKGRKPGEGPNMSVATKVVVQINCKLGGAPWTLSFPKGIMTIGFDVTHDSKNRNQSYGAFVATMDMTSEVRYFTEVSKHTTGQDICDNIDMHIQKALEAYKNLHGCFPSRIFYYRDGVGEGDVQMVHQQELQRLVAKIKTIYGDVDEDDEEMKMPKITFTIVSKRINTRFFENKEDGNVSNPVSGTVVDSTVTLPERYDFYLISQNVRQGTVAPTSYNIIYDTSGLSPDKIQAFTYKQCHMYYNWSGTVRVPAVVQYSHKLAKLVGEHLHDIPSSRFNNQLYFL